MLGSVLKALFRHTPSRPTPAALDEAHAARASGHPDGALAILRGILSRDPQHGEAHYFAGMWLAQSGRWDDGVRHLEQATALAPHDPDAQLALGNAYRGSGDAARAEACYRRVIALAPGSAAGYYNLALVLRHAAPEAALGYIQRACDLAPDFDDAWAERVLILVAAERYDEAIFIGRSAGARMPASARLHMSLGCTLQKSHRPAEALQCYERAHALGVADHELFNQLAIVQQDLGRMEEALASYAHALELKPDFTLARFHRALARLARREYGAAWDDYDLRLLSEDVPHRASTARPWHGEPLAGRSIAVLGEQGLGDEIMFASCFNEVIEAAARCTIVCSPRLEGLFQRSFPGATVVSVAPGAALQLEAQFEVCAGSVPRYLRRTAAAFPRHAGYLQAAPERVAYWKSRLDALGPGLKVGISWRGGTYGTRSPLRTVPLPSWSPVLAAPGTRFVSLQYGDQSELAHAPGEVTLWEDALANYDETAALVSALDLVISVCTAVIHLGGALARPVWVMAPVSPEWRYGVAGDRMDWYPSARVFRQREHGQWSEIIAEVARELRFAAAAHDKKP